MKKIAKKVWSLIETIIQAVLLIAMALLGGATAIITIVGLILVVFLFAVMYWIDEESCDNALEIITNYFDKDNKTKDIVEEQED